MRLAIIGLIALGVIAAVSAAILVGSLRGAGLVAREGSEPQPEEIEILVATKSIAALSIVSGDILATKQVRRDLKPKNALTNPIQVIGRMLIKPVLQGEPFTEDCFGSRERGAQLAASLPSGMRAVSVPLRDYSGLEGLLYPGCLVDVLLTFKPSRDKPPETRTLLQAVEVLAIEQYSIVSGEREGDALRPLRRGESRMVTLMVNPDEAKMLMLAMEHGSISLTLRNPLAPIEPDANSISLNELSRSLPRRPSRLTPRQVPAAGPGGEIATPLPVWGEDTAEAAAAAAAERLDWEMTIIHGGKSEKHLLPPIGEEWDDERE